MLIDEKKFRRKIQELHNLPAFPGILDQFNEMVQDPTISMNKIGELIGKDQALSVQILKLVNSAFYGFPGRISTVTHALVLLGYDVVKGLILSASVFEAISDEYQPMWRHSLAVSKACGLVCEKFRVPNGEEVAMAGLLHDVGKIVLMQIEPEAYTQVINAATKRNRRLMVAEQSMLGFDHSQVAAWLCDRWNIPQRLAMPMAFHHEPENAKNAEIPAAAVFLADNIVKAMGCGAEPCAVVDPMRPIVEENFPVTRDLLVYFVEKMEPEIAMLNA